MTPPTLAPVSAGQIHQNIFPDSRLETVTLAARATVKSTRGAPAPAALLYYTGGKDFSIVHIAIDGLQRLRFALKDTASRTPDFGPN